MPDNSTRIDIFDQSYQIRGAVDPKYLAELAAYVDQKMRAASDAAPASDMLGLAVLVALNIADEFFREREREIPPQNGDLQERAVRLERIVDEALAQVAAKHGV